METNEFNPMCADLTDTAIHLRTFKAAILHLGCVCCRKVASTQCGGGEAALDAVKRFR